MAIISARIIGAKQIEKALLDAFEVWAEEDINDAHWDDQFRDMDEWEWPGEIVTTTDIWTFIWRTTDRPTGYSETLAARLLRM